MIIPIDEYNFDAANLDGDKEAVIPPNPPTPVNKLSANEINNLRDKVNEITAVLNAYEGADLSNDYIPLEGTREGLPITGDLEVSPYKRIYSKIDGTDVFLEFSPEDGWLLFDINNGVDGSRATLEKGSIQFVVKQSGLSKAITLNHLTGFDSSSDFTQNYPTSGAEDKIFPQIKWVKQYVAANGGGFDIEALPVYDSPAAASVLPDFAPFRTTSGQIRYKPPYVTPDPGIFDDTFDDTFE